MSRFATATAHDSGLLLFLLLLRLGIHQRRDVLRLLPLVHLLLFLVQLAFPRNRFRPNRSRLVRQVSGNQIVGVVQRRIHCDDGHNK